MRRLAVAAAVLALSACAERRPYRAPVVPPAALQQVIPASETNDEFDAAWWRQFDDPVLDQLEVRSLRENRDVRIAIERVVQSRAIFDEASRLRRPAVTTGASVDVREQAIPGLIDEPVRSTTYRAGFDMFWEVDLFGRVRSAIAAAAANAQSYDAELDGTRVIVAAEVALNYFELRGLQRQLDVLQRSVTNQRETLRLTTVRRDAGVGEEQDVASAAARVAAIESAIPPVRSALAVRSHRLAVLAGTRPGQLQIDLAPRAYPPLAKALPIGDSSTLLTRRPDVRAAERRLATATAREGIAAAALYPRVTIAGFLGLLAGRGSLFGTTDSRAWAITPALSWSAFDIGGARARLRGAESSTRESLETFEGTVLRALEETENAFVGYHEDQQRLVSLTTQARESERAAGIARARYREGVVDFLALLDAERTELQAESAATDGETAVFVGVVGIYKALGGSVQ